MSDGKKIGYTSGVFDMFHIGHLRILERARSQCDTLIVGVSTDELVQQYKEKTPIIPFNDRVEIVSAIRHVDRVVPQESRDKFAAWERLNFNIMFVGDDWKGNPLFVDVEKRFSAVGVAITYFPYTKGISSSRLTEILEMIEKSGNFQ